MSNLTTPFLFDNLLQAPAPQPGYTTSNSFVRNSGLYDVQVYDATLITTQRNGKNMERIQIRAYATHKEHPEHSGRAIFSIFVPDPTDARDSDYIYISLSHLANVVREQQAPDGRKYAAPDWQVRDTKGYNDTIVKELTALKNKRFVVALRHGVTNAGKAVLNVDAVFSPEGYSSPEVLKGAAANGLAPVDITHFVYTYEGNDLEPVQRSAASTAAAANSFQAAPAQQGAQSFQAQQAPQYQSYAQAAAAQAPQAYAPQPAQAYAQPAVPQQPAQDFAQPAQSFQAQQAPQQAAPQAPQYQSYAQPQPAEAFAAQQQAPYGAAMTQGAQPVDTRSITQQQDDVIPF